MKKKKKGRPSLLDLQKRNLKQEHEQEQQEQEQHQQQSPIASNPNFNKSKRRSTRRNPNLDGDAPVPEWIDGEGDGDDDDERKEKKVKLVVRLPPFNQHYHQPGSSANSVSLNSVSYGSDSNADGEDHEASAKKRKINAFGDRSGDLLTDQEEKVSKVMDTLHGSSLESGPTTPLPDKKLLVFILDRLQKKDTYGVFSEPVDPNELPDYHEIIEHPMDFGTVRKKLDDGLYPNLEEFEADILLICSNAMQYNAPDTIYFRQARSIQELAKRDFENLRQVSDDGEPRPKVVRRGRPPSKNLKKSLGRVPIEHASPHFSTDATVATGGDNTTISNSYNLRKPISERCQSTDALVKAFNRSRNNGTYGDWSSEWNGEFPASILKAEAKFGKKQCSLDEHRRATYNQSYASTFGHESSVLSIHGGDMKQLIGVGLHLEHGYARSLARFAANLGPVAWKIVSKKLESILPTGLNFGPGWVGENETPPQPQPPSLSSVKQKSSNNLANNGNSSRLTTPSTSCLNSIATYRSSFTGKEDIVEDVSGHSSQNESAMLQSGGVGVRHAPSFWTDQKHASLSDRNGFNGMFAYGPSNRSIHSGNLLAPDMGPDSCTAPEAGLSGKPSWQGFSPQVRHHSLPVPPDLNTRFQAPGSPSSSFRIGSPQQPDLALQL